MGLGSMVLKQTTPNQDGYKFYVYVQSMTGTQGIESGWEYRSDAQDRQSELIESFVGRGHTKVLQKRGLKKRGLDAAEAKDWLDHARLMSILQGK